MIQALVLINAQRGKVPQTAERLLEISEVTEVFSVTGNFDLIALVKLKEYEDLTRVVTEELALIETITRTETMLAFKVYSRADLEQSFEIGVE